VISRGLVAVAKMVAVGANLVWKSWFDTGDLGERFCGETRSGEAEKTLRSVGGPPS
jgi:hypothetical protein